MVRSAESMKRDEQPWTPAALAGLLRDPQQLDSLVDLMLGALKA